MSPLLSPPPYTTSRAGCCSSTAWWCARGAGLSGRALSAGSMISAVARRQLGGEAAAVADGTAAGAEAGGSSCRRWRSEKTASVAPNPKSRVLLPSPPKVHIVASASSVQRSDTADKAARAGGTFPHTSTDDHVSVPRSNRCMSAVKAPAASCPPSTTMRPRTVTSAAEWPQRADGGTPLTVGRCHDHARASKIHTSLSAHAASPRPPNNHMRGPSNVTATCSSRAHGHSTVHFSSTLHFNSGAVLSNTERGAGIGKARTPTTWALGTR